MSHLSRTYPLRILLDRDRCSLHWQAHSCLRSGMERQCYTNQSLSHSDDLKEYMSKVMTNLSWIDIFKMSMFKELQKKSVIGCDGLLCDLLRRESLSVP